MEKESDPTGSTGAPMAFNVLNHLHPLCHSTPEKPSIHICTCHAKTHGIKPGSGDNLLWARLTNGHQLITSTHDMLQLSGSGTHGIQLSQPKCSMPTGLADGRGPGSGSHD